MRRAIDLARRGEGAVEPNPMVGCVIARDGRIVGEGWHARFGGPHAEINAIADAAQKGESIAGGDLYVTLEPCRHHGKTPPCTAAIVNAGIRRVVAAQSDPFPQVAGQGLADLRQAGLEVETGVCEALARDLNAPYRKLLETGRPWVIAKWAMTIDGKLATRTGDSRWISNESSRSVAHALRARCDAVLVGIGTALADDPLLTARPPGPRVPTRVILDSRGRLPLTSQLVSTCREAPVIVVLGPEAPSAHGSALASAGCEVLQFPAADRAARLGLLLDELGRRRLTNLLVEGGAAVLGEFFDLGLVDEVVAFIAPKVIGGAAAPSPVGGAGRDLMSNAHFLQDVRIETLAGDAVIRGRISRQRIGDNAIT